MTEATGATYRQALAEPVYRVVFGVRSVATVADTLRIIALSVLIFSNTGSAVLAAAAFGAGFMPQAIGGVVLGALPDLVRPRPLIVAGYLAECAGAVVLGVAGLPVWASLGLVAGLGCLVPVLHGSSGRLVARVLTGDVYVLGRSLMHVSSALAQLVGMGCGGLAVAAVGPRHALLLCAAGHLIAAVTTRLRLADLAVPARTGERAVIRRSLRGTRTLLADPALRELLLVFWLPPALVTAAEGLVVPYAAVHGHPAGAAGLALACVPVGMLVGDLVVARLLRPATRERIVAPLIGLLGLPLTGFALDVGPWPAAVLLFLTGCGFGYGLGVQRRFRDAVGEDGRGQAFGLMSTGLMTLQGIGPVVFGGLAEVMPIGLTMAVAGAMNVALAAWLGRRGFMSERTPSACATADLPDSRA
jgi:predicted MFS family arabinose efflux permease